MRDHLRRRCRPIMMLALALACAAAAAPSAPAATPFTLGVGDNPSVAVGADGSGHVVWLTIGGDNTQVGYCRISPRAEACNRTELLNFGDATAARGAGRATVFAPAPDRIVVVGHCWQCGGVGNRTYRWISTDNGSSFGAPTPIGKLPAEGSHGFGTWLDDANVFVTANSGRVKAVQTATEEGSGVQFATGGSFYYDTEVVRLPGTHKLVAAVNDLGQVRYGVYTGADASPAQINDGANWLVNRSLPEAEAENAQSALSAGPNGVLLTYRSNSTGDPRLGLRRFDTATDAFGGPTYIAGGGQLDRDLRDPDSFQDPSGRIHAVWGSLYDGQRLRYTVSDTAGTTFAAATNLAAREGFHEMEVAAGPDGTGFVTWTNGAYGTVRAVPIDPWPEPQPAPAPPATAGSPAAAAPTPAPPATYSGPFGTTRVRVGQTTISLLTPRACLSPGQRYRVTLRWKARKRKGRHVVKVFRTDFYVDSRRVRIDRRAPFVQTFLVAPSSRPATRITLRARAFIKVKRRKAPTKSLRTTIRTCG